MSALLNIGLFMFAGSGGPIEDATKLVSNEETGSLLSIPKTILLGSDEGTKVEAATELAMDAFLTMAPLPPMIKLPLLGVRFLSELVVQRDWGDALALAISVLPGISVGQGKSIAKNAFGALKTGSKEALETGKALFKTYKASGVKAFAGELGTVARKHSTTVRNNFLDPFLDTFTNKNPVTSLAGAGA